MKCQCLECVCEEWFDFVSEEYYLKKKELDENLQLIEFLKFRMDKTVCENCDRAIHKEKFVITNTSN